MRAALQRGGVLALCALACSVPAERPPLVLVVALDSLAAGHCGAWGHARATTPHLDALAAEGVRFADASSQSSWTLPSVASLFTGLEQERHGLRHLGGRLGDDVPLLAERFAAAGFETHAVVQTPLLRSSTGLGRGFGRYEVLGFEVEHAREAVGRARAALEAPRDAPLFLYVHLAPPHMPYRPPAPFAGRFVEDGVGDPAIDGGIESCRAVHELGLGPDAPDMRRLAAHYDEHVAFADALLGELAGLVPDSRDALLVALSDHGEAFGQHGVQGHNTQVHVEMLHVPLVVVGRGAWALAPRVVEAPVSLLDLAPTFVERFGLAALGQPAEGLSLDPWLRGETPAASARVLRSSSRYRRSNQDLQLAQREGALKLVLSEAGAQAALYDLARDPHETRDLGRERPADAARMQAELRAWYAERAPEAPAAEPGADDARVEAELRALGYAGD